MNVTTLAALVYLGASLIIIGFQLALALGAPWGEYAMGGRVQGRFPAPMRVAAVVQAAVLAGLAWVVLAFAGVVPGDWTTGVAWLVWIPVVVAAVSVAMNAASRSPGERRIWVPVGLVLLGSSVVVALTAS